MYLTKLERRAAWPVLALSALMMVLGTPALAQTCSVPNFSQPPIYPVGSDVRSLATGDFDSDGRPDLAVANADSNSVSVITQVARPQTHSTNYNVGTFPISITAGDFNGDSRPDLVTANNSTANVSLLLNNGAGFSAGGMFFVGDGPRWVVAGDFNRDGKLDLAVAGSFGVAVLLGNGQGGFGSPINTGSGGSYVVAGDFNNDSKLDLAVGNSSIEILLGDGTGRFVSGCGAGLGQGIVVGDLNADGKLDLVSADVLAAKIHAMLGDGTGCFGPPFNIDVLNAGRPRSVALGDLNNDGKLDIIGGTAVMLGDGTGVFGSAQAHGTGNVADPGSNTVVTDFDGDGKLDIATAGAGSVGVLLGDGSGGFQFSIGATGRGAYGIESTDLNADGKLDLVIVSNGSVIRKLGDGAGNFSASANWPVPSSSSFSGPVTGDFNRDAKLDVVALDATHNGPGGLPRFHVLLGDGLGGLGSTVSTSFDASEPAALAGGDWNGDGKLDLLTVNRGGGVNNEGSIAIVLGDGAGHFGPSLILSVRTAANPKAVGVSDFNGDGKVDLAVPSGFGFSILLGDGVGGFSPRIHTTTANAASVTAADLNGDGRVDLAMVSEESNGKLSTVLGDGTGAFGPPTQFSVGAFPEDIVLADFNGDGKIDAAVANAKRSADTLDSSVAVLFGDGTGNLGPVSHFAADRNPWRIVSGDFNNDGRPDLITANQPFNNLSLFLNSCTGAIAPASVKLSSASYTVAEAAGNVQVTVSRTDTSGAATVNYATSDNGGLNECNSFNGIGSSRCDYATSIGTLRFAAGEAAKTIFIPIVDDAYAEGNETLTLTLSNPTSASLGSPSSATITIQDNDTPNGANPIDGVDFFIRQNYIDFLGREPDPAGLAGWRNVLNNCGITVAPPCDRIEVSAGFFRSEEFQSRGYFIYRFFSALGRIPLSHEFYPDFAKVSGFLTADQLEASKAAYVNEVMARADFQARYSSTFNNPTAYVDALLQTVGLPAHPSRGGWISTLNASNTTQTRGQVLRQLVESAEVYNKYYNEAFVIMQYFGYLRRTADASYLSWINTMNQTNGDYRTMINGFLNSAEYRRRFGP